MNAYLLFLFSQGCGPRSLHLNSLAHIVDERHFHHFKFQELTSCLHTRLFVSCKGAYSDSDS